jgi:hypothetical protein
MAVVLASACAIVAFHGLPRRFEPQALSFAAAAHDDTSYRRMVTLESLQQGNLPTFGNADAAVACLVWDDSHAMSLMPGIDAACKTRGVRGFQVTNHSTAPLLNFFVQEKLGLNERAPAFNRAVVDHTVAKHVDVVFIVAYWVSYADRPGFESALRKTVHELAEAGVHVVLVRDVARFPYDQNMKLSMAVRLGRDVAKVGVPDADYRMINKRWNDLFDQLAGDSVSVLDLSPAFVDETGLWRAEHGGVSTYCDHDHLTTAGSLRTQPLFQAFFDGLPTRP